MTFSDYLRLPSHKFSDLKPENKWQLIAVIPSFESRNSGAEKVDVLFSEIMKDLRTQLLS